MIRNILEYSAIVATWYLTSWLIAASGWGRFPLIATVLLLAGIKTIFFGGENLQQLWMASLQRTPYYRFMALMLVNVSQIVLSFGLDYHCLQMIDSTSFGSISPDYTRWELIFEFIYFSVLNFTFFGYGDVTPQTIPAKLLTLTEIVLAFFTVIFLLSDFVSLTESLLPPRKQ
jgi:hypothetical protein